MAQIIEVADLNHPALACYAHLTNAQLRSRLEPEQGVLIAESPKVIHTALDAGLEPVSFLMERKKLDAVSGLLSRCGVPVYTADRTLLASLTGYALTRGVLCALRRPALPAPEAIVRDARRVAVLEHLVDATNVGAVFRSAAALGLDAVLLSPGCCDPFCRRAVRVGMGTVFQVPWTYLGDSPVWSASARWASGPPPWPCGTTPSPSPTPGWPKPGGWPSSSVPRGTVSPPRPSQPVTGR